MKDGHTHALADAWANSTHFNAAHGYNLDGVPKIVARVGVKTH